MQLKRAIKCLKLPLHCRNAPFGDFEPRIKIRPLLNKLRQQACQT